MDFKKGLFMRALAYATYSFFVTRSLLALPRQTRVLVVTNPPFAPALVWLVATVRRINYTVMLLDLFPEGLVALGSLSSGGLVDRLWSWANNRTLKAAHQVWVLGRDMLECVVQRYGVPRERIRYLPHWSSVDVAAPATAETTDLWRQLRLDGKFVVQYSGNMGIWHDLDTIVRAAALLQEVPGIHFLLIGDGRARGSAKALSDSLALGNVTWLPFRAPHQLGDSLACCHAALISQRSGLGGVAVPCKLYGILASGRAVLAQVPEECEVALVVNEEKCGVVVRPGDAGALSSAILEMVANRNEVARMGKRGFEAYRSKYTLEAAVSSFQTFWSEGG